MNKATTVLPSNASKYAGPPTVVAPTHYIRTDLSRFRAVTVWNDLTGQYVTVNAPRAFFTRGNRHLTVQASNPADTVRCGPRGDITVYHL